MHTHLRRKPSLASPQAPSPRSRPSPRPVERASESLFPHLLTPLHPGDRSSQSQNGLFPILMAHRGGLGDWQSGRRKWICNYSFCFVGFLHLQARRKASSRLLFLLLGQVTQTLLPSSCALALDYLVGDILREGARDGSTRGVRTAPFHTTLGCVGARP